MLNLQNISDEHYIVPHLLVQCPHSLSAAVSQQSVRLIRKSWCNSAGYLEAHVHSTLHITFYSENTFMNTML